jgi:hypothetical protein
MYSLWERVHEISGTQSPTTRATFWPLSNARLLETLLVPYRYAKQSIYVETKAAFQVRHERQKCSVIKLMPKRRGYIYIHVLTYRSRQVSAMRTKLCTSSFVVSQDIAASNVQSHRGCVHQATEISPPETEVITDCDTCSL